MEDISWEDIRGYCCNNGDASTIVNDTTPAVSNPSTMVISATISTFLGHRFWSKCYHI